MILRWIAGILFTIIFVGAHTAGVPILLLIPLDAACLFLFYILVRMRMEKDDHALSKQEKMLLLPGLVLYFPASILLTFVVLGPERRLMLRDTWRMAKYATLLFFVLLISVIVIATIIGA